MDVLPANLYNLLAATYLSGAAEALKKSLQISTDETSKTLEDLKGVRRIFLSQAKAGGVADPLKHIEQAKSEAFEILNTGAHLTQITPNVVVPINSFKPVLTNSSRPVGPVSNSGMQQQQTNQQQQQQQQPPSMIPEYMSTVPILNMTPPPMPQASIQQQSIQQQSMPELPTTPQVPTQLQPPTMPPLPMINVSTPKLTPLMMNTSSPLTSTPSTPQQQTNQPTQPKQPNQPQQPNQPTQPNQPQIAPPPSYAPPTLQLGGRRKRRKTLRKRRQNR